MITTAAVVGEAAPSSAPLLQVSALAVRFGPLRALDGVDLAVRPGELVALAGENGAGKTTLVRCIAADIRPTSGEVHFDGRPVSRDRLAAARQGVAVVWQDLALCANLDIASNLLLGRESTRLMLSDTRFHARAAVLLKRLGLHPPAPHTAVAHPPGGPRQHPARGRARPHQRASAEPSSSLHLIMSALGAALGIDQLCVHVRSGQNLTMTASSGLTPRLVAALANVAAGVGGGQIGRAIAGGEPVVTED